MSELVAALTAAMRGGTDAVLWELVAAGMAPDYNGYESAVGASSA